MLMAALKYHLLNQIKSSTIHYKTKWLNTMYNQQWSTFCKIFDPLLTPQTNNHRVGLSFINKPKRFRIPDPVEVRQEITSWRLRIEFEKMFQNPCNVKSGCLLHILNKDCRDYTTSHNNLLEFYLLFTECHRLGFLSNLRSILLAAPSFVLLVLLEIFSVHDHDLCHKFKINYNCQQSENFPTCSIRLSSRHHHEIL